MLDFRIRLLSVLFWLMPSVSKVILPRLANMIPKSLLISSLYVPCVCLYYCLKLSLIRNLEWNFMHVLQKHNLLFFAQFAIPFDESSVYVVLSSRYC